MADLAPRIEKLVGRLVGGRGGGAAGTAGGSRLNLRPGDAGFAEAVARFGAMPLPQFAREGAPLEICVAWLEEALWFVPDEGYAEALVRGGTSRGRIWTTRELSYLMTMPERAPRIVRTLALAKMTFEGDIREVKPR